MDNRTDRLKAAIEQLKQVDMEVLFPVNGESAARDTAEEDQLLFELKGVVDVLRTSIWCHFKAKTSSDEAQRIVDHYRMQRVVEMLRQISGAQKAVSNA